MLVRAVHAAAALAACALTALAGPARADSVRPLSGPLPGTTAAALPAADLTPRPVVGFRVRGPSKVTERTMGYLARVEVGQLVSGADLPRILRDLTNTELFTTVDVTLEQAPDGVVVVATVHDKHSWIVAPTLYILGASKAVGVGFGENDFGGRNQKFLAYAQLGQVASQLFAVFLDPAYHGTKLTYRIDAFAFRRNDNEYVNPRDDPRSKEIAAIHSTSYGGGGLLVGWRFRPWLVGDLRARAGMVWYRGSTLADGKTRAPTPQQDGFDASIQTHWTADRRNHLNGVTWGPYAQLTLDHSVPKVSGYQYGVANLRIQQAWKLFGEHQLELRGYFTVGRHLPFHEEFTLGSATDLRGYDYNQFRGDTRVTGRAEYSVPVARYKWVRLRAIGFFDSGSIGFAHPRTDGSRTYLPNEAKGNHYFRNDFGAGIRIYVGAIVLPLVGVDLAYGIEGHSPELYLQVGLTDF